MCKLHTGCLLRTVTSNSANDGVLLSAETVDRTVGVSLRLGSLVLGLPSGVFLLARLGPRLGAGQATHGLDNGALEGVELPGGFTIRRECQGRRPRRASLKETYEGSEVLLVDMSKRLRYEKLC